MSIKIKLFAVFFLLFVIVVAIVVYSRINIGNSADLIEQTYDKPLMASNFARDSLVGFLRLQKNVAHNGYDDTAFPKLYNDVTSSLDVVQERLVSPKSQPFLDKSRALLKDWADEVKAGDTAKAKQTGVAFESETDLLIENEFSAAHDFVIDTRAKVDHYNTVLLVMNGICLLVSFAGGLYLFLSVYRPIKSCIGISQKIAAGHFDNDIEATGSLEFRHLLVALKEMQGDLVLHIEERQKVLNCLGQGFLMFGRDGICTPVYSRSCQTLLEATPPGKHIADILRLDAKERWKFDRLLKLVFDRRHVESLTMLDQFAPHSYRHSQGMHVRLDYKSDDSGVHSPALENIIVIATDITKQVQAQNLAEEQKNAFESIERVLRDRRSFGALMRRAMEFAETITGDAEGLDLEEIRRETHTLKGGVSVFKLTALTQVLHELESALAPGMSEPDAAQIKWLGTGVKQEIAAVRTQFNELLGSDVTKLEAAGRADKNVAFAFAGYLAARGLGDVRREYIRRVCMEPFRESFRHFDVQLEDLAARFNKKIFPIRFTGADVPILADGYRKMLESFVHIFRNIMDHGIEPPDERRLCGKDESGRVEIRSEVSGDTAAKQWLKIEIGDDGAGIDVNKVREKLYSHDPEGPWLHCSEKQIFERMLSGGVSTNSEITHFSGRGIGLNAVYHEVQRLGGSFTLRTTAGQGTVFAIKVPYLDDVTAVA